MSCDVGKALLILQPFCHFNYVTVHSPMGGSPGESSEELVTLEKRKKGLRMSCDVGEANEGLENELRCR